MSGIGDKTIGFIGAGQMATALASGFVDAGLVSPAAMRGHDPGPGAKERFCERFAGASWDENNAEVVAGADIVFLAVKPQLLETVAEQLQGADWTGKLLVSIVTGYSLAQLETKLGAPRVVRVMPNTPSLVGVGASAFACGQAVTPDEAKMVESLLNSVGLAHQVKEPLIDAITGLSGSGPAYIYLVIEALSDGGVCAGLPRDVATQMAAQTVLGAATMVLETKEHPGALKDRVTSPGGTTIRGLQVLEERAVRSAMFDAVQAAAGRATELGKLS